MDQSPVSAGRHAWRSGVAHALLYDGLDYVRDWEDKLIVRSRSPDSLGDLDILGRGSMMQRWH